MSPRNGSSRSRIWKPLSLQRTSSPLSTRSLAAPLPLGVGLVLLTDERRLPLGYTDVPANEKEYEPPADLLTGPPTEVVIADKGLWGRGCANDSPPTASRCSPPTGSAPTPTLAANVRWPPLGS